MKQLKLAGRYFLIFIMVYGLFSAMMLLISIIAGLKMSYDDFSKLGGIVGTSWWVFRIINHQIDNR